MDIFEDFFEVGYNLFRDRDTFRATFLAADLFASGDTPFSRLRGSMDVVWAGNFLHLFLREKQRQALISMLAMLNSSPGAIMAGRFMGHAVPGEYHYGFRGKMASMYRHDQNSFRELCEEVFRDVEGRWNIDVQSHDWVETLNLRREGSRDETWTLEIRFIINRLD